LFGYKHNLKTLKSVICSCFLLIPILFIVEPALSNEPDSLFRFSIPEVVIEQARHAYFREDKKISSPDSLMQEVFFSASIGEILPLFTSAYINSTGSGGASSSMFLRGTNSYQTSVTWNGFLLNSLTLGSADLSAIPVAAVQDISVIHGASGSLAGSGNFGGSVLLENRADWDNRIKAGLQTELGTFDNRHFSFNGKFGNQRLQYHLSLFSHDAENNFTYSDIYKHGDPVERIKNNALENRGMIQNLFLRLPGNNNIEAGIWYQAKRKEIPAIMGSYNPGNAMQRDSSLRVYTKWTKVMERSLFSVNTAVFSENMLYRDKENAADLNFSIDSEIQSRRLMGDMNYRVWISDVLSLDAGATFSHLTAKAVAYSADTHENQVAAITALKISLPGFTGNISARKEFHTNTHIPFRFALGAAKKLPVKGLTLRASYSDQFRVPTFNDKYWQPGGNPGLKPESGYTADIGMTQSLTFAGSGSLHIEVSAYNSLIKDMIQWVPGVNGNYWEPLNKKEVSITGYEAYVSSGGITGDWKFVFGAGYNYAMSVISKDYREGMSVTGNQLIYIPLHTGSSNINITRGKSFAGFSGNYTGSRYTTEDNNTLFEMPSHFLMNGYVGSRISAGDISGNLRVRVMNLFNTPYQVVRSYPMAGRSYHLSFSLEFMQ
jgi:vitamin B12 transporter